MGWLTKFVLSVLFVALLVAEWHFSKARIQDRVRENEAHQARQKPPQPEPHRTITVEIPSGASGSTREKIQNAIGE